MCQFGLFLCVQYVTCVTCSSVNRNCMHFFIWFVTINIMGVRVCTEIEYCQWTVRASVSASAGVSVTSVHVYNFCLPLSFV